MAAKKQRFYVLFKGRVQGVGFRFFVQREAHEYGLTGWVRNRSDNGVELEVDGSKETIQQFLESLKNNHPYAQVSSCMVEEKPKHKDFVGFNITY